MAIGALTFETTIVPIAVSIATALGTMYLKSKWDARTHESKLKIDMH